MAKTIYSQGDKVEYGIKVYVVDTEEDRQNLTIRSAKMGSKCYVIGTKKWYILNGSYTWDPFVDAGGSGGSESPFDIKGSVATTENLPTEDNQIGDLYLVQENHSLWVWTTSEDHPNGYWVEFINSELFIIQVSIINGYESYTADKTYLEIQQAYNAKKMICAILDGNKIYQFSETIDTEFSFTYCYVPVSKDQIIINTLVVFENNEWQHYETKAAIQPQVITSSNSNITITPVKNTIYKYHTLASLTINDPPLVGEYSIIFFSGSMPTVVTGIDNFTVEANKRYKINVEDGYATFDSWSYTP